MDSALPGRILIVEDEWTLASVIEAIVRGAGYEVAGPAGDLDTALGLATSGAIAAALLDIELGPGVDTYPVAKLLQARDIPFAFVSARAPEQIDGTYATCPLIRKPFEDAEIVRVLEELVQQSRPATG
ncbi:response regulator [Inquilinus limosus]|uniref:response regulator n=1 Tax=Inquilinus limosus TaxID=171674 RepID=UPI003F145F8E